jgi:GT2 family glycosyltransferase
MAKNLASQTYKNFEWLILDDYKDDRSEMLALYAKKYNIDIKYIRGDRVLGKYDRRYALARANNKSVENASGELIVWLQDFILLPEDSIEKMVNIYRRHPNALIAPTDVYYFNPQSKPMDLNMVDDYWRGNSPTFDELVDFSWKNVRNNYSGMRFSNNPFEFEMNIGATPKAIIEKLNGWYEFFDDGLGFDNTQIAHRALESGYKLIVDDTNVAKCINLYPIIGGTNENLVDRERCMAVPHWEYYLAKLERGVMPLVRDPEVDKVRLKFRVPDEIPDEDCALWTRDHAKEIANEWIGGEPHG